MHSSRIMDVWRWMGGRRYHLNIIIIITMTMMIKIMEITSIKIYWSGMLNGKAQMIIKMMMTRQIVGNIGEKILLVKWNYHRVSYGPTDSSQQGHLCVGLLQKLYDWSLLSSYGTQIRSTSRCIKLSDRWVELHCIVACCLSCVELYEFCGSF